MNKKGQNPNNNQLETTDDLLDFDLNDLDDVSSLEIERAFSDMDDDIIELTDLVEEGSEDEETQDVEVANWLKESRSLEVEKDFEEGVESGGLDQAPAEPGPGREEEGLDLSDISLEFRLEGEEEPEPEEAEGEGFITEADLDFLTEEVPPGEETQDLAKEEMPEAEKEPAHEIGEGELDFLSEEGTPGKETLDFAKEEKTEDKEAATAEIGEEDFEFLMEEETSFGEALDFAAVKKPEDKEAATGGILEGDIDSTLKQEPIEEKRESQEFEAEDDVPEEPPEEEGLQLPDDFSLELEPGLEDEAEEAVGEGMILQPGADELREEEAAGEYAVKASLEEDVVEAVPRSEGWIGLSEERIEAAITRVVEEVVERVARETMSQVAEKVITEAIEALRKSLESTSE